ncbi:MAG: hypothetical protein WA210_12075 [Burkholderiaceae bacterium]
MSAKQLVEAVQKVESSISTCMRESGFQYIAADYATVRRGMLAEKNLPGVSDKQFVAKHGFGIATLYVGEPPQLSSGYSPGRDALGERNVKIFKGLSPADRVAYNRALFGENTGATFALGLEQENFSMAGGCTKTAIAQVFKPDEMKSSYYNPKDALINKDPRMQAALRKYAVEIRKAGFDYSHPDEAEPDVRKRLMALTAGGTIPLDKMTPSQRAALKELQDYERRVAVTNLRLTEDLIEPLADKISEELFGRKPQ